MTKIKGIVFDFSGVIVSSAYVKWCKEHIPNFNKQLPPFKEAFDKMDLGLSSKTEFEHFLTSQTQIPEKEIWAEILSGIVVFEGTVDIIKSLKGKYKIGLLTNYSHEAFLEIWNAKRIEDHFDEKVISSRHNMKKPQKEIYFKILEQMGLEPDEAVFIDDQKRNIDAAEELGMKGILFTSPESLKESLEELGIF